MSSPKPAARRHLALHTTLLGLARWRLGIVDTAHPAMPQAVWHAAVQRGFMDWLSAGGVKQVEQAEQVEQMRQDEQQAGQEVQKQKVREEREERA